MELRETIAELHCFTINCSFPLICQNHKHCFPLQHLLCRQAFSPTSNSEDPFSLPSDTVNITTHCHFSFPLSGLKYINIQNRIVNSIPKVGKSGSTSVNSWSEESFPSCPGLQELASYSWVWGCTKSTSINCRSSSAPHPQHLCFCSCKKNSSFNFNTDTFPTFLQIPQVLLRFQSTNWWYSRTDTILHPEQFAKGYASVLQKYSKWKQQNHSALVGMACLI